MISYPRWQQQEKCEIISWDWYYFLGLVLLSHPKFEKTLAFQVKIAIIKALKDSTDLEPFMSDLKKSGGFANHEWNQENGCGYVFSSFSFLESIFVEN
jgi:hypothetical protein